MLGTAVHLLGVQTQSGINAMLTCQVTGILQVPVLGRGLGCLRWLRGVRRHTGLSAGANAYSASARSGSGSGAALTIMTGTPAECSTSLDTEPSKALRKVLMPLAPMTTRSHW